MKIFRCIRPYNGFTVGKLYYVNNNTFIDDNGHNRVVFVDAFKTKYLENGAFYWFKKVSFNQYLLQAEECVRERDEK